MINCGIQNEEHCDDKDYILDAVKITLLVIVLFLLNTLIKLSPPPSGRGDGPLNSIGYRFRYVWQTYKFTVVLHEGCDFDSSSSSKYIIEKPVIKENDVLLV